MSISNELFKEIFDEFKQHAIDEYDGSTSHAYFNIVEVIDRYRKKCEGIDDQTEALIVSQILTPQHEAFPE